VANFSHPGGRLRHLREVLKVTQGDLAQAIGLRSQGSVSDWETKKVPVDPGWLRLASDLCANDREVFQWLRDGGRMPVFLPLASAEGSGAGNQRERRRIAERLRALAEELDPTEVSPEAREAARQVAADSAAVFAGWLYFALCCGTVGARYLRWGGFFLGFLFGPLGALIAWAEYRRSEKPL